MLNPHTDMQSERGSHENRFGAKKHPSGVLLGCFGPALGPLWHTFAALGSPKASKKRPGGAHMIQNRHFNSRSGGSLGPKAAQTSPEPSDRYPLGA